MFLFESLETHPQSYYMRDSLAVLLLERFTVLLHERFTWCYMRDSLTVLLQETHCLLLERLPVGFVTWATHCFVTWETHFLYCYMRGSVTCRRTVFLLHEKLILCCITWKINCFVTWETHFVLLLERPTFCFITWETLFCYMRLTVLWHEWQTICFEYVRDTLSILLHEGVAWESLWFVTWETNCLLCYTRHSLLLLFAWDPKWFVYFSFNVSILNLIIVTEETCSDEMFDCNGDKKKCIHRDLVCNYINDCGNWNDEALELCNGKCVLKYVT